MPAAPQEESTGRLERVCQGLPAVEVDCSDWEADIPAEAWSRGRLVDRVRSLPPVEVDCSGWSAGPSVWLELVVTFRDDAKPIEVMEHAKRLIGLAAAVVPDLGLTYAPELSRTEGDTVVIALIPRAGSGAEQSLAPVIRSIGERLTVAETWAAVRLGRAA